MYSLLALMAIKLPYKAEQQEKFLKLQAEVEVLLQHILVLIQQQKLGSHQAVNNHESTYKNVLF